MTTCPPLEPHPRRVTIPWGPRPPCYRSESPALPDPAPGFRQIRNSRPRVCLLKARCRRYLGACLRRRPGFRCSAAYHAKGQRSRAQEARPVLPLADNNCGHAIVSLHRGGTRCPGATPARAGLRNPETDQASRPKHRRADDGVRGCWPAGVRPFADNTICGRQIERSRTSLAPMPMLVA